MCQQNQALCGVNFGYDFKDKQTLEKELDQIEFGPAKLKGKELLRFLFSFTRYESSFEGDQRFRSNLSEIPLVGMNSALWRYMTPAPMNLVQETTGNLILIQASMHEIATGMISKDYLKDFGAIYLLAR